MISKSNLLATGGAIAMVLAGIVSYQSIERPWAPRSLVIEVGALTADIAEMQIERRGAQLLANQIKQSDLKLKGLRVDDAYLQQEQRFKNDIKKLERQLEGLKK